MASPALHRLAPETYDRIVATGALDGEPVEFVDGLLVRVSPQGPEHAALVQFLTRHFASRADLLRVQMPIAVSAFVNSAVRRELQVAAGLELLAADDDEFGAVPDGVRADIAAQWPA